MADDDHAIDKLPIYIKVLPRPVQKLVLRYCTAPVLLFLGIVFFLVILPLSIQDYVEEASRGLNNMFLKDPRYKYFISAKPINRWLELGLPFRREVLTSFTPYVSDPETGCIDRGRYRFEFVRLLGLNPYRQNLSQPHVLVVGEKTEIGAELLRQLNESDVPIARVGCQNSLDFASPDAATVLADVHIADVVVTCPMVYPRFARSDGLAYAREVHSEYLRGLGKIMQNRSIPWTLVVEEPLERAHGDIVLEFGGRVIVTSPMQGLAERTARECAKVGKATVELKGYETYSDLAPSDVAVYVMQNLRNSKFPKSVVLTSAKEFKMRDLFEDWPDERCRVTVRANPHRSEPFTGGKVVAWAGNNGVFGRNQIEQIYAQHKERESPYVSFVMVGRDETFSKGFEGRLQNSINSIGHSLERIPLADIELVIVDYATPEDRPPLHETVTIPKELKGKTRFIRVPMARHQQLQTQLKSSKPFFEYIARNIGIRRAKGNFVIATNPDNIFPSTLFEAIAAEDFNEGVIYRSVRWDAPEKTDSMDELWQALSEPWRLDQYEVQQVCSAGSARFVINDNATKFRKEANPCGSGDFLMLSKNMWATVWGFTEAPSNPNIDEIFLGKCMRLIPGYPRFFIHPPTLHQWHETPRAKKEDVSPHDTIMEELACTGESRTLTTKFDTYKWGLYNEDFDEILL